MYTMQAIRVAPSTSRVRGSAASSSGATRLLRRGESPAPQNGMSIAALGLGMRGSTVARGSVAATALLRPRPRRASPSLAHGAVAQKIDTSDRWWEKGEKLDNLVDVADTAQFLEALGTAGDRLVVVDFYAHWCGACRSLYPKLQTLAKTNEDVLFLKVNFDANKAVCKSLSVKVLPYFHIYRGAKGRLAEFSCSITRIQRLRDALEEYGGKVGRGYKAAPAIGSIDELQEYSQTVPKKQ